MENSFSLLPPSKKIKVYEVYEIEKAIANLEKYDAYFAKNKKSFSNGHKARYTGDYTNASLKRATLDECVVEEAVFINASLTGSKFFNTEFLSCNFDQANFQFSNFYGCKIRSGRDKTIIEGTNCDNSSFYNTELTDVQINASSFTNVIFDNCMLQNCSIGSCMFENAMFKNSVIKNMNFKYLNIEFVEFLDVNMHDVSLPFFQIPYTFGGLKHIYSASNHVKVFADNKFISIDEYNNVLNDLAIYFSSIFEYFPLANIYIHQGDYENAFLSILNGLRLTVETRNFRMLKFYSKLAASSDLFSKKNLRDLYNNIQSFIEQAELTDFEARDFSFHSGEIKSILLDQIYGMPSLEINMQTNIDNKEVLKIAAVIDFIDTAVEETCGKLKSSFIEIRHNSLCEFLLFISSNAENIVLLLSVLAAVANLSEKTYGIYKKIKETNKPDIKNVSFQETIKKQETIQNAAIVININTLNYNGINNTNIEMKE